MEFIQKESLIEDLFGLQGPQGMDFAQQLSLQQVVRRVSYDTVFDRLLNHTNAAPPDHHSSIEQPLETPKTLLPEPQEVVVKEKPSLSIKKRRKNQKKQGPQTKDYQKNICGYITRRAIRQFIGTGYTSKVISLLQKYGSSIDECKAYYTKKVQFVTGPSHIPGLLTLQAGEDESLGSCKRAFLEFFKWFLKHRYLRYLLREGKMANKQAYIHYKNHHLFKIIQQEERSIPRHEGMLSGSLPVTSSNSLNQIRSKNQ